MFESKNLIILAISAAIIAVFGYILLLMLQPSPYAAMVASHVKSDNNMMASQVLATIKGNPGCGKLNISRSSLLKYDKDQECFMLKTEIEKHRRPTDSELSDHGSGFISDLSSKLKTCMSPEKQRKLVARVESGPNLSAFLDEIDRSRDFPGKLKRVSRKMMCGD